MTAQLGALIHEHMNDNMKRRCSGIGIRTQRRLAVLVHYTSFLMNKKKRERNRVWEAGNLGEVDPRQGLGREEEGKSDKLP